jgi:antitoxin component of RelBE/YafQ-DinJ toxin-antitoxin module
MGNSQKQQILEREERDDYLRFRLPEALKERFKLYCYLKGITMSDTVREMIEEVLRNEDLEKLLQEKLLEEKLRDSSRALPNE